MFDFSLLSYLVNPVVPLRAFGVISASEVSLKPLKASSGFAKVKKAVDDKANTVTLTVEGRTTTQHQSIKPDGVVVLKTEQGLEVARLPARVTGGNTQFWKVAGKITVMVSPDLKIESTKPYP